MFQKLSCFFNLNRHTYFASKKVCYSLVIKLKSSEKNDFLSTFRQ